MPRYFTHYWTNQTWEWNRGTELLDHTAGNQFRNRGVSLNDSVYIVTVIRGKLYLAGKLKVYKVCDFSEAASILETDDLWEADEHIVASEATRMDFQREIPIDVTESLKFRSGEKLKPLTFTFSGYLDQQTLRGVRELDEDSALELDKFLPPLQSVLEVEAENHQEISPLEPTYPDEVSDAQTYSEGAVKQVLVNAFERSLEARQACIDHYGSVCSVCAFNFEKFYGDAGKGFIHVHHIKPLSERGEAYEVDYIQDLRPVCPNCHAMLHRQNPPYGIDQLKQMVEENRGRKGDA